MPGIRRYLTRAASAAAIVAAAAACTDGSNPAAPKPEPPVGPGGGVPVTVQALRCTGTLQQPKVSCVPETGAPGGVQGDIIVGGQHVYVNVVTTGETYNSGTGQFTFQTTLQNLIEQPMGTTDGTTLDPNGIRIFFNSGPNVTSGTGTASVLPDGFATFLSAGQAYYQYNQVLAQNATSSAKTWTLVMPPTVSTFDFVLYVSAPVEYPNGYITLNGNLPGASAGALHPGSTVPLTAVVKSAVGNVVAIPVTFNTTDPLCATVSPGGVVTGVRAATCNITADAAGIPGSLSFDVTGTIRTWDGSVSTDWSVNGNWVGDLAPVAADSVLIPTGTPNAPFLVANTSIGGVNVADGATLTLGAFNLTVSANVATGYTVGSGILGTSGSLILAGSGEEAHGRVPSVLVTGTYSLDGDLYAVAPQQVDAGNLTSPNYMLQVVSQ
ncbi:MAG TPA: hypothetical protein VFQ39_08605 [Longimicrobium sp.]|nr:hypothetical protein [Longimicrobium sp.]